ncbi:MAG: DUF2085 domain-containing protein [Anaerolineae bacterium]|nr:DUF2085 domain-containing protein [Anaerolineae bacterium]
MSEISSLSPQKQRARVVVESAAWFSTHWLLVLNLVFGIWILLPFTAPVFMKLGWTGAGQAIYSLYSAFCHQMAQRSFFLFGSQPMYNVADLPIQLTGYDAIDLLALRAFLGNVELGWKVAWSDRMVFMYGSVWLAGVVFGWLRRNRVIRPLRWHLGLLLATPLAIDGITHLISDISGGLAGGFRYSNQWLVTITDNAFPGWFYIGDSFGSFNSSIRLFTGILFGIAVIWFAYPYIDRGMLELHETLKLKLSTRKSEFETMEW